MVNIGGLFEDRGFISASLEEIVAVLMATGLFVVGIFIRRPERWLRRRFASLLVTGFPLADQFVIGHLRFGSKSAGEMDRGWGKGCWWIL